jgi:RNA polymerase sigma-70 factor, ECF subfamily
VRAGPLARIHDEIGEKGQLTEDFEGFFRAQFPHVARSLGLLIGDREEGIDLAQEAFARAWTRWDRYASADHARNSVMRIGINLARSESRRRRRLGSDGSPERASPESDVPTRLAIVEALRALSERQRTCIVLIDYLGMDSRDVGRLLRIPSGSVRTHLARGRKRLRGLLDEESQEMNR